MKIINCEFVNERRKSGYMKERFIELLEEDAVRWHNAAEGWKAINGARVEDLQGRTVATAADMVERYSAKEKELRELIDSIKELP